MTRKQTLARLWKRRVELGRKLEVIAQRYPEQKAR